MIDKAVQYYIDKNKMIDIRVDRWSFNRLRVSIYNDRNDSSVVYTCTREELKGLADFLYKTIEEIK
jgi:Tfp pilus assembly pilus retraction ATPase PilT